MIETLSAAANVHPTVTVPLGLLGSSVTLGNVLQGVQNFLLGGTMIAVFSGVRRWRKDRDDGQLENRKVDVGEDSSLRSDLLRMIAEMRTDHANQISDIRREQNAERVACAEAQTGMQKQIDGLVRQIVAFQVASGRAIELSADTLAAGERALHIRDEKLLGDIK